MQLLVYILVYPLLWLVSMLPFRLLYLFSDLLFLIIYRLVGYRTQTVKDNLRLTFPEKTDEEIKKIQTKFYRHLCDMMVEAIKSMTISKQELAKRFTFSNIEVIKALESKQRNIALMCGHYGSWEWIFILQTYIDYDGYAIYKRLENKYFDRLVKRIRARHNSYLITTKETFDVMTSVEKEKRLAIYGFAADQSPRAQKAFHWNQFMGITVPMHTGAEMLAKKHKLAVVFFSVKRLKRGFYQTTFELLTENPNDIPNYQITDQFFSRVEKQIRQAPEYYLWTHKRWKHRNQVPEKYK